MNKVLVIGASGFVGKNLAKQLLADGYTVRCLARTPSKIQDLAEIGCEVVKGDILDKKTLQHALHTMDAVYVSIHTLRSQEANTGSKNFMDAELLGLKNVLDACRINQVNRIIYLTFLGVSPDAESTWIKGRWEGEQLLLKSGLQVTAIRPGMIVGLGGQGFDSVVTNAKKKQATILGAGTNKMIPIAISDLVYYLTGVLEEERSFGECFNVGNDEQLTMHQMIDMVAEILGNPHPKKRHIPLSVLRVLAPLIERISKMSKGAIKGSMDSMRIELTGNTSAIRTILPAKLLTFREASEKVLKQTNEI